MMADIFIVAYRWTDLEPSVVGRLLFDTQAEAEAEVLRIITEEARLAHVEPAAVGKLEITVERFTFAARIGTRVV